MTTEEQNESIVIRRIVEGELHLFAELVKAHQGALLNFIMRQVGNQSTAEDLTQEIFIKAYTQLPRFKGESKFKTWLTRIAINHMSNYFTSKRFKEWKKTESFDSDTHQGKLSDPKGEGDLKEQRAAKLRTALGELPMHYRDAIVLCGLNGLSYVEAAETLQIPVGTVRSRLNKARLLLKDLLSAPLMEGTHE